MATTATCESISGLGSAQYIVYAVLGTAVVASEALGLTKSVKPNAIIDVVMWLSKTFIAPAWNKRMEPPIDPEIATAETASASSPVAAVSTSDEVVKV